MHQAISLRDSLPLVSQRDRRRGDSFVAPTTKERASGSTTKKVAPCAPNYHPGFSNRNLRDNRASLLSRQTANLAQSKITYQFPGLHGMIEHITKSSIQLDRPKRALRMVLNWHRRHILRPALAKNIASTVVVSINLIKK